MSLRECPDVVGNYLPSLTSLWPVRELVVLASKFNILVIVDCNLKARKYEIFLFLHKHVCMFTDTIVPMHVHV